MEETKTASAKVLDPHRGFPLAIDLGAVSAGETISWYHSNREWLAEKRDIHGAVLLRNTGIRSTEDFEALSSAVNWEPIHYRSGNSPRTKLSSKVYTSTEFAADRHIPIHNELSYSHEYPSYLMFVCIVNAESGGETPLASSREVYQRLDPEVRRAFEEKGLRYVRNLHGGIGMGPSWQVTFETEDRKELEKFLAEGGFEYRWKEDGGLWLAQNRPAILVHPRTGDKVWFNQSDEFHPSVNGTEVYQALLMMNDNDPEALPMYCSFGDKTEIPEEYLSEVRRAISASTISFPWQEQDIVLLDNLLVGHGRNPYTGDRKILVTMGNEQTIHKQ